MANETIRIRRGGVVIQTASLGADGRGIIQVSAAGWPQGSTQHLVVTAEDAAREMLESLPAEGDVPVGPPGPIWEDAFDRADGAPGNGWAANSIQAVAVTGGMLTVTQPYGFYGVVHDDCGGGLPADLGFRVTIPHAMRERNVFGLAARVQDLGSGTLTGVQFFLAGSTWFGGEGELHPVWDLGVDPITKAVTVTDGYPASWDLNQDHTLEIRLIGTRASLVIDGQEYGYFELASAGVAGRGVALVGDASASGGWSILEAAVFPA